MARLFGTDGVRGLANRDLTAQLALDALRGGGSGARSGRRCVGPAARLLSSAATPAPPGSSSRPRWWPGLVVGRGRRAPGRRAADAGGRLSDRCARRRLRRDAVGLAQPDARQRDQVLRPRRPQARRRRRGRRSRRASTTAVVPPTGAGVGRVSDETDPVLALRRRTCTSTLDTSLDRPARRARLRQGAASVAAPQAFIAGRAPRSSRSTTRPTASTSTRLRLDPSRVAARRPWSRRAPTPASRSTVTPTAAWPSTRPASRSTATTCWRSWRWRCTTRDAGRRHRRRDGDEQPRLPHRDARGRRRRRPGQGRRPLRARGDAARRLHPRRRAVRPRDHERLRDDRRRHPRGAARRGADGGHPAVARRAGRRDATAAAGAGQRPRRRPRPVHSDAELQAPSAKPSASWASPAGCCCGPSAPSRWCG